MTVINLQTKKMKDFVHVGVYRGEQLLFSITVDNDEIKKRYKDKDFLFCAYGEFSEYLPDWHPWEDYRTFYMAKKSQGGGSILDQSHIIDLSHYLLGVKQ